MRGSRFVPLRLARHVQRASGFDRQKQRRAPFPQRALPHLAAPREQQAGIQIIAGSNIANACAWLVGLSDDPQLLRDRPAAPALPTHNDFDDALRHGSNRTLTLALRCPAAFVGRRTGGWGRTLTRIRRWVIYPGIADASSVP